MDHVNGPPPPLDHGHGNGNGNGHDQHHPERATSSATPRKFSIRSNFGKARQPRSRKNRPCDACRRRKTACVITSEPPCERRPIFHPSPLLFILSIIVSLPYYRFYLYSILPPLTYRIHLCHRLYIPSIL